MFELWYCHILNFSLSDVQVTCVKVSLIKNYVKNLEVIVNHPFLRYR